MKTFNCILLSIIACIAITSSSIAAEIFTPEEIATSFDLKEIDEKPIPVQQTEPKLTAELKNQKGRVYVAFIVTEQGKVNNLRCIKSTSDMLESVVLQAVEKWKFKPGKMGNDVVAVRVVLPIRVDFS